MIVPARRGDARAVIVGEEGPADGKALFPYPTHRTGGRLCSLIMRLSPMQYLDEYARVNLCHGGWDSRAARRVAREVLDAEPECLVLLGSRVCAAFGVVYVPFAYRTSGLDATRTRYVVLPHPSARNRMWNDKDTVAKSRRALIRAKVIDP